MVVAPLYCKVRYVICLTFNFIHFLSFDDITYIYTIFSIFVVFRFVYVPPFHTKEILSDVLLNFLFDWNMDRKISTITMDNCSSNDDMIDILSKKLSLKGSLLLKSLTCDVHQIF